MRILLILIIAIASLNIYGAKIRKPFNVSLQQINYHFDHNGSAAGSKDYNCGTKSYNTHSGTDFSLVVGTDIVAPAKGKVVATFNGCANYGGLGNTCGGRCGNYVKVDHGDGTASVFCHMKLNSIKVTNGQTVSCGQILGQSASSGNSSGPHLHFGWKISGVSKDPFSGSCSGSTSYWVTQNPYPKVPGATCSDGSTNDNPVDDEVVKNGTVTFLQPQDGLNVTNPVTFRTKVSGEVKKVKYYADGDYFLGESSTAANQFAITYRFNYTNVNKVVVAKGYDATGKFIKNATDTITIKPLPPDDADLAFTKPLQGETSTNPVVMQSKGSSNVVKVKYYAENEYFLGESTSVSTEFKTERMFSQTGWRKIEAYGYSQYGTLLSAAFDEIDINIVTTNCQNTCDSEGATRCSPLVGNVGDDLEVCKNVDGCLTWTIKAICPQAETCNGTECVAPATGCRNDCMYNNGNTFKCDGKTRLHCEDYDNDECYEWFAVETCGMNETCVAQNADECTNAPCTDECTESQVKCDGNEVKECGSFDNDVCLDWGTKQLCDTGKTCRNGLCVNSNVSCTNQCTDGSMRCQGLGVQSCHVDTTTGCTVWTNEYTCKSDQTCSAGKCIGGNSNPDDGNNGTGDTTNDDGGNTGTNDDNPTDTTLGCYNSKIVNLGTVSLPYTYTDSKNTNNSTVRCFHKYLPNTVNEGGPEYVYMFKVSEKVRFKAYINTPEPANTDIDLHLIKSLDPNNPGLVVRDDKSIFVTLNAGTYYLSMDTYVSEGTEFKGNYTVNVSITKPVEGSANYFNEYIIKAVNQINSTYKLKGYNINSAFTHNLPYGTAGVIKMYGAVLTKTMCVAAALEVIVTAMDIYARETGDTSVWNFLPKSSWERQNRDNIKGHIWVDHSYSHGTAHALSNFGMGEIIRFQDLLPGSFINLNRTSGSGHAVIFMAFIDLNGNEHDTYPSTKVIGFKYYSAQGGSNVGEGGFDYRWAIFSGNSVPASLANKRIDKNVINSTNQQYLNTGMMLHPSKWQHKKANEVVQTTGKDMDYFHKKYPLAFDPKEFDGLMDDDEGFDTSKSIDFTKIELEQDIE